jgi:hypothetical protein
MNEQDIQELRTRLRGERITPSDAAYDAARKVYNGMIDKRPALIARCADVADVIASVSFARASPSPGTPPSRTGCRGRIRTELDVAASGGASR